MAIDVKTGATPATVLELARQAGTKVVDVRFIDLPGTWQHFSLPLSEFDESSFSDGLGFGDNTKAALLTRGLTEIARFGVALGAEPQTFWGLAGMGDLITTCFSRHGRNRRERATGRWHRRKAGAERRNPRLARTRRRDHDESECQQRPTGGQDEA